MLDINPDPGSVYIRAQCEPFNKRMELSGERLENWLRFFKVNQDNENKPYQCHASGHACGPDILGFIEDVKPKKVVPIHTEKPQLFDSITAEVDIPVPGVTISF